MSLNNSPKPPGYSGNGLTSSGRPPQPAHHDDGKLHKEKKKRNFLGMKK
jgi:hypothetical protein